MTLYTIGHGTRSLEELLSLLREHQIGSLVDVRAFPASRTNPQFNKEALAAALESAGIGYRHEPALGGRRRGLGDASPNQAWEHPAFRAYADYMMTAEFRDALDTLLSKAKDCPTAIMCSETLWWRCHRRLIADAAVARDVEVVHILGPHKSAQHKLAPPAIRDGDRVVYTGVSNRSVRGG